jgi:hypothetical protein
METKPELVQISSAWNTREGAPIGRNRYMELQIKKAKANGDLAKQPPFTLNLREICVRSVQRTRLVLSLPMKSGM